MKKKNLSEDEVSLLFPKGFKVRIIKAHHSMNRFLKECVEKRMIGEVMWVNQYGMVCVDFGSSPYAFNQHGWLVSYARLEIVSDDGR